MAPPPARLVFHARRTDGFGDVNARLALQNAPLMAHALGVGHFYTGWVLSPCRAPMARQWHARVPSLPGMLAANCMHRALALGYPAVKFRNRIQQNPRAVGCIWTEVAAPTTTSACAANHAGARAPLCA